MSESAHGPTRYGAEKRCFPAGVGTGDSMVRRDGSGARTGAVQVVAHRGSSDDAPEHTLSAYKVAIADGADALECDVRLTRDGHLVCVHDRRINRTSNGRGVLSTLELAELEGLDWGSWRDTWEDFEDPELPDRDRPADPHAAPAPAGRGRRRPAGPAGDRDQAPDALRRPGGDPAGAPARRVRVGRGRGRRCGS